ncbi:MAG: putative tyrosine recombinase XerC-like protein [Candidatus Methanolliviera sp. GoM_asphalt]|nr:MAG: putative tyrosine recombinase XerC-like protein [Candidatus Methanolliviera sp. GoM_asphalt]
MPKNKYVKKKIRENMPKEPKDDIDTYFSLRESETEERIYKSPREEIAAELRDELGPKAEEKHKLPAILTREECKKLLNAFKKGKKAPRNRLIIRLLYATGIRIEELANLKFCDIFYDNQTIFIREGKGKKDRYVCADLKTFELLKKWQEAGQEDKPLEDSVPGIKIRQIRRIVEKAGDITGISQKYDAMNRIYSAHSFRHAFATHLFENGMSLFAIKKLLGHEFLETTEIYINCTIEQARKEYKETNPLSERDIE